MTANILILDSNDDNISILKEILSQSYCFIHVAKSIKQGIDTINTEDIDLIIATITSTNSDVLLDAFRHIRLHTNVFYIPIIIVSDVNDCAIKIDCLKLSIDEYFVAPVNRQLLLAKISNLIRAKNSLEALEVDDNDILPSDVAMHLYGSSLEVREHKFLIIANSQLIINQLLGLLNDSKNCDNVGRQNDLVAFYNTLYDVVIIDSNIVNEDPFKIYVELRSRMHKNNTRFFLIVNNDDISVSKIAFEMGFDEVSYYPIDTQEFLLRIITQIKKRIYRETLENNIESYFYNSIKDKLTSLYNKRYFDVYIERLINKYESIIHFEDNLHLCMIDIDFFKSDNDTFGHVCGDQILSEIAKVIRSAVRNTDIVCRYGGEEFAVLIHGVPNHVASEIAHRILYAVRNYTFKINDVLHKKTVSIGIAHYLSNESSIDLIKRADAALYMAKNNGRNAVSES